MDKARILLLTTSYPSHEDDPSSIFLSKLAVSLKNLGYTVRVLAPSDGTFFGRRLVHGIETFRFAYFWPKTLHRLTVGSGGVPENLARSNLAKLQVMPMLFMFLIKTLTLLRHCDVIYANWIGAGIIGATASLLSRKPMVISFRGDDGYLARDRPLWRVITRWVSSRADVVAPVSSELADILVDLGVDRDKIRLPLFGVDTDMFHPALIESETHSEVRVLFVGSLIPRKGLGDLLSALADPELQGIRLTVVGDGFLRDELSKKCQELGLDSRVDWEGLLTPAQVASIMRSSDMLCLPSYMEGAPNVVKEAMASGLPVIASRIGGIPQLITDGETGLLFDAGNVDQLRTCLKTLTNNVELRRTMGKGGHDALNALGLDWAATADDFDSIFQSVI